MAGNRKKEIDPTRLKELAGLGLTQKEMARCLGMSESTFYVRLEEQPELLEFMEQGKAEANAQVASAFFQKCLKGDMSAIKYWYQVNRGIKESLEVTSTLSDEELISHVMSVVKTAGTKEPKGDK